MLLTIHQLITTSIILIINLYFLPITNCQFPAVCAKNLTTSLPAVCCPNPPNSSLPCGGPGRGVCLEINAFPEDIDLLPLADRILLDDRLAWPTRFFQAACYCQNNYEGYACQHCKLGWTGFNCDQRRPLRIRRNVLDLSLIEQRKFRDRILLSKKTPMTEWLVINITDSSHGDPVMTNNLQLINPPSIYDYFVFIHLYASRSSLINENINNPICNPNEHLLDFAHKGPGFLPWHRSFLLMWENELGRLGAPKDDPIAQRDGDNFAFPYWDWTGNQGCPVCTNDLVGAPNPKDSSGRLDPESVFYDWITYCPQRPGADDCHICDPGVLWTKNPKHPMAGGPLWRKQSDVKVTSIFSRLPDQIDVDQTLKIVDYDIWPYNMGAGGRSFRDVIEGFSNPKLLVNSNENMNLPITTPSVINIDTNLTMNNETKTSNLSSVEKIFNVPVYMHNMVHSYFNGSWFDVSTSPNDPIFILHHSFVDKLFELWIRKHRPLPEQYPRRNCPPGHSAYSPLVPFFPIIENIAFFVDSRSLGYDYDNYKAGNSTIQPAESNLNLVTITSAPEKLSLPVIGSIVLSIILLIILIGIIIWAVIYMKQKSMYYTAIDQTDLMEQPHISALSTWRRARFANSTESYPNQSYYPHFEKVRLLDSSNN